MSVACSVNRYALETILDYLSITIWGHSMALISLMRPAFSINRSSLILWRIIHELVFISQIYHLLLIYQLLLNILTSQMLISILLWMVSSYPRIDQRLLNVDWLHLLMALSDYIVSIRGGWRSHGICSICWLWLFIEIIDIFTLLVSESVFLSFSVLISTLWFILDLAILLFINVLAVWLWIIIFRIFLNWGSILILGFFLLLLLLLGQL